MAIKHRGPKSLHTRSPKMGINWKFGWQSAPYGGARRKAILTYLLKIKDEDHNFISINRRHCLILKRDPDLRRLLKEKKVKMINVPSGGKGVYSGLVINEEV